MLTKLLTDTLKRAESWPNEAQEELAAYAMEIEARLKGGVYHATTAELEVIDRGIASARDVRFASEQDIAALFAARHDAADFTAFDRIMSRAGGEAPAAGDTQ